MTFDTAALPVAQQFEALAATVGVTHDVTPLATPPAAGFAASAEIWMLNQTVVSRSCFDPLRFSRSAARARRDGVDTHTKQRGGGNSLYLVTNNSPTPEPASVGLLATAAARLGWARTRRRRRAAG